jgi:hypothetical protein
LLSSQFPPLQRIRSAPALNFLGSSRRNAGAGRILAAHDFGEGCSDLPDFACGFEIINPVT